MDSCIVLCLAFAVCKVEDGGGWGVMVVGGFGGMCWEVSGIRGEAEGGRRYE